MRLLVKHGAKIPADFKRTLGQVCAQKNKRSLLSVLQELSNEQRRWSPLRAAWCGAVGKIALSREAAGASGGGVGAAAYGPDDLCPSGPG